jgi:hypothetical protein
MSILSKEPDGLKFHYGWLEGDNRQINIRKEARTEHSSGLWYAYVGGRDIGGYFPSKASAEQGAISWAKANPETREGE